MGFDVGIASRLRAQGLKVVEVAGWTTRGSASFDPRGSVDHHTAGPRTGNAPSLGTCINGRPDLPGPLCNVFVARDNTCHVVAAGRANHAGRGGWRDLEGNSSVYGVERENVGNPSEPWRPDQTQTAARVHAALLRGRGISAAMLCEHREWAPERKPDAHSVSGTEMRRLCAAFLAAGLQPPLPPGPITVTTFKEDNMKKFDLDIPLDANGNGFRDLDTGKSPDNVVSIVVNAANPPENGFVAIAPGRLNVAGKTRVTVAGGPPTGRVGLDVWVAD